MIIHKHCIYIYIEREKQKTKDRERLKDGGVLKKGGIYNLLLTCERQKKTGLVFFCN